MADTQKDTKQYLDHAGLVALIKKIKAADAADKLALEKVIGVKDAAGTDVDLKLGETTYTNMKAYVDAAINSVNGDASALTTRVAANEAAIKVLNNVDGSAESPVEGSVAAAVKAEATRIDGIVGTPDTGKTIQAEIDAVEARLETIEGEGAGSIKKAIADLDATVRGNMDEADAVTADDKVGVKVVEEDGVITGVTVVTNDIASAAALAQEIEDRNTAISTAIGTLGNKPAAEGQEATPYANVKDYVDTQVAAINGEAGDLADRVEDLEGLHATKDNGDFKTVAEEVNEAVTALVDGAPDALDTLKEIADWIANQDESGVTDAATLLARVEANASDISDLQDLMGEDSVEDQIDAAIEALDATVGSQTVAEGKHVAVEVVEKDGKLTGLTVTEADIASADALSKLQAVVGYSELSTEEGAVTGKTVNARLASLETGDNSVATQITNAINALEADVESEEDALVKVQVVQEAGVITDVVVTDLATAISEAEINALFENPDATPAS